MAGNQRQCTGGWGRVDGFLTETPRLADPIRERWMRVHVQLAKLRNWLMELCNGSKLGRRDAHHTPQTSQRVRQVFV